MKEIIYIYDALCGWCYGFSPVVKQLKAQYGQQFAFSVRSGGMVTGERVEPLARKAAYIKGAMPRVEEVTGVKFGEPFLHGPLASPTYVSDSTPPAVALAAFRSFALDQAVEFAHEVQRAFYHEGKDLHAEKTYTEIAQRLAGVDEAAFLARYRDPLYRIQAEDEFMEVQGWGVQSFPTLLYFNGQQLFLLAQGYAPLANLDEVMQKILRQEVAV
ncbi:MAG: DsbA family protein [Bernardetiaceae bacterium]|jgi:putative protein-disulfide isomerase|nr:DsbA family protein [Bernardetiaceae bacterium]